DTPFLYTGGSLEISTEQDMTGGGTGASGNFTWEYTTGFSDYIIGEAAGSNSNLSTYKQRPNIRISHMASTPCSGSVVAGVATTSNNVICGGVPLNLTLNGATLASGITYQWQSSPAGANTWTDIVGANTMAYTTNQNIATDYRCVVTCTNSNSTDISTVVSVGQNPFTECYCTPAYTTGCATYPIHSFKLIGDGVSEISDLLTGCNNTNGTGYSDRRSIVQPVNISQDNTYP